MTGLSLQYEEGLPGKLLGILRETAPTISTVAVISNPASPLSKLWESQVKRSAPAIGVTTIFVHIAKQEDLTQALHEARRHAQAIMVVPTQLPPITVVKLSSLPRSSASRECTSCVILSMTAASSRTEWI